MFGLFRQRSDFGILPGGMEEVALFEFGRERVYLKRRKGFIKYALQHGDDRLLHLVVLREDYHCQVTMINPRR